MSEQSARLPCPFCGHRRVEMLDQPRFGPDAWAGPDHRAYVLVCTGCAARGGWGKSSTEALRLWNTRAVQP